MGRHMNTDSDPIIEAMMERAQSGQVRAERPKKNAYQKRKEAGVIAINWLTDEKHRAALRLAADARNIGVYKLLDLLVEKAFATEWAHVNKVIGNPEEFDNLEI